MNASSTPEISIVVPVYNEEENIPALVQEIASAITPLNQPYEIILVDDGSSDKSVSIAKSLQTDFPPLRVLEFARNAGQSAALHAGLNAARGGWLVSLDGDLQNDPADIPRLLELLKTHDLVCGYRRQAQGHPGQANRLPHCQFHPFPICRRRRSGHGLHAQGLPPRGRRRAASFPGNAPIHPRAGQRRGLFGHGDSGQSPPPHSRCQQIQCGGPGVESHDGHVRRALAQ
ncbi:glycosyltransferase family 2 protein [Geitlerinema calcuttense]|uniref:Glycosyltransferase family 2 protein n=1 Tax=Geitlerinema calcuttense NRMC-F 0142 TaxID=2922238 RepID=A0ABT7M0R6_9CYAN|nr:glycosyltransferase family 2 protein [Geitlerinema calcuttense]MDL5056945.1 glycosyltransferase family 2 protein [Geitlerinema calcuttense NRMC-F 0142]